MFVITGGTAYEFPAKEKGDISVFALSDVAKGVKIKGLSYEYEGNLKNDFALGVSNSFCGKEGSVSLEEGALLIVEKE